jgi:predicted lipoprotein
MCFVRCLIAIAVVVGICWLFPLFHIVPLETATAEKQAGMFDATKFAENFWTQKLLPATGKAVSADVLLAAIQSNPAAAKTNYAHSFGLSDSYIYFLRGKGKVIFASDDEIGLAISQNSTNAEIVLEIGPLFGNTVRDGCGLLNASDYSNSQDFNDISAALNHIVETQVLPKLREQAKVGAKISFVGCAEVDDESNDLKPLKIIPIQTKIE